MTFNLNNWPNSVSIISSFGKNFIGVNDSRWISFHSVEKKVLSANTCSIDLISTFCIEFIKNDHLLMRLAYIETRMRLILADFEQIQPVWVLHLASNCIQLINDKILVSFVSYVISAHRNSFFAPRKKIQYLYERKCWANFSENTVNKTFGKNIGKFNRV